MNTFTPTPRSRVKRMPERGRYETETVYEILDAAAYCHVGYVIDGKPYVTPTAHWRHGNRVFWHGSAASRMLEHQAEGHEVCLTVTHVDGFVLARSGFHHSINYRSVMAFGRAEPVRGEDEKRAALDGFIERLFPAGPESCAVTKQELKGTLVLSLDLTEASAKIRTGPPKDDEEDYASPVWAGVLPLHPATGAPVPDPLLAPGIAEPPYLSSFAFAREKLRDLAIDHSAGRLTGISSSRKPCFMPIASRRHRSPSLQRRSAGRGRTLYQQPRLLLRYERRQWYRLTPPIRAMFWAVGAALSFSLMGLLAKDLGQRYSPIQVAFFRSSFGLIPLLPSFIAGGFGAFRTARPFQHLFRGLVGVCGMFLGFYAVARLPLAKSTAISFTTPLYMIFMAVLFLGEQVRWRRWTATLVGFAGVLIIVRPFDGEISVPMTMALSSAFISSIAITLVKRLSGTEASVTIVFYLSLIASLCSAIPSWFVWLTPTPLDLLLFLLTGLAGGTGQILITQAYYEGEATAVAPVDYLRLLFAILFGYCVFGEVPTWYTLAGSAIIIGSTLYIAHRERQLRHPPPRQVQIAIKTH